MIPATVKALENIYYDPQNPAGLGGVDSVYRAAKQKGIKVTRKKVEEWISSQETYSLHKPARRKFKRNRVIVAGIDDQWQTDLVDLRSLSSSNKGYNYLLVCIDVFSKYLWVIPLKTKHGKTLVTAFKKILESGRKPVKLQSDKGTEFLNKEFQSLLKKNNIYFFTTQNEETKASVVERVNRTLKTRMWKYFTWKNTYRYIDVLSELVNSYNNRFHRSIGRKPSSVNAANEDEVREKLYGPHTIKQTLPKFSVGDHVRISKYKKVFDKGYLPNWSREIFTISEIVDRTPVVYRIKDYEGEELQGTFYEQELLRFEKDDDVYQVETVFKQRKRQGKIEYFVKWLGYPNKFNSWVPESAIQKL